MIPSLLVFSDYGLLALRIVLGFILISHGLPKLRNIASAADTLRTMGFRPVRVWTVTIGVIECVGGLLIVGGLFVQVVALVVAAEFIIMVGARRFGGGAASRGLGGYEFELLILAASLLTVTVGAGSVSLDDLFRILLY